jgi:hypothetical protein
MGRRRVLSVVSSVAGIAGIVAACTESYGTATDDAGLGDAASAGDTTSDVAPSDGASEPDASTDAPADADATGDGGSDADCGNVPQPKTSIGPFCFQVDAGNNTAANKNCSSANHEICCNSGQLPPGDGGFANSSCLVVAVSSPGYVTGKCTYNGATSGQEIHCTEAAHCPGKTEVCCAIGTDAGPPNANQDNDYPGCPAYFTSGKFVGGTRCRTSCAVGELQLCTATSECTGGTCMPLTIGGRLTGICRP